jgi:hypothetical protein
VHAGNGFLGEIVASRPKRRVIHPLTRVALVPMAARLPRPVEIRIARRGGVMPRCSRRTRLLISGTHCA